jgi:Lrp/AsnC family transcriptional regulator
MKIEDLDILILRELQLDSALPLSDLAERVGSSKSVCSRRIQQYLKSGVIRERVALLDGKKLGLGVTVFVDVTMERHSEYGDFFEAIKDFPEVIECHVLSGRISYLLKVVVRDVEDYERFFWAGLSKIKDVREINSYFSMTSFIDTTRLPLDNVILD